MRIFTLCLTIALLLGCTATNPKASEQKGVSKELASMRKASISNLCYTLNFTIPDKIESAVEGSVGISFSIPEQQQIVIDYRNDESSIHSVEVNGEPSGFQFVNEHIIVSARTGDNVVKIAFTASDQSLNRREEFLYSLLVPDRARTLFPCFDQPNLKARFTLHLTVPDGWSAVTNSPVVEQNGNHIKFAQTEPLSTYLFSIVAGKLECVTRSQNGRVISLYHRETDSAKLAQTDEIFRQVYASLDWLEDYTDIKYPFAKYDLIILPGFQYGGMEHTGATLYSDRTMFLNPNPTLDEELSRCSLIAHETAHMWFGDYVTMDWFSDVWTKEVFANYFASRIVAPQFPEVNHQLNFMLSYLPSAYAEDRTAGANPIQQELDNLCNAGLVYGSIIYKKSPVVMDMLVRMVGEEKFRRGIQSYLRTYGYSNATWDNLIEILDKLTERDLAAWSDAWVKQKGMPTIEIDSDSITQSDPLSRGVVWSQPLAIADNLGGRCDVVLEHSFMKTPVKASHYIPNADGRSYGFFRLDSLTAAYCMTNISSFTDEVLRGSLLITLYENLLRGAIEPYDFQNTIIRFLPNEANQLLFSEALGYAQSCNRRYFTTADERLEETLWSIYDNKPKHALPALRALMNVAQTGKSINRLYTMWSSNALSERDAISLSYQLAIRLPDSAQQIINRQLSLITNRDRRGEYLFISPAVSSSQQVRDSVFDSLLEVKNREVEPWVQTTLALLNHPLRQKESLRYIRVGLDEVAEIQQTGDIFFPTGWCGSLLGGHNSAQAKGIVHRFFADNPDYPEKLALKIKQRGDHLLQAKN